MTSSPQLSSNDELTLAIKAKGLSDWASSTEYIRTLPYGRNANREDIDLVLHERKGSCSSKHAFLKKIADLNGLTDVKLILAIYLMNETNTPEINGELVKNGLSHIPEAHCYLKVGEERLDFTSKDSDFSRIKADVINEQEISPEQVSNYKVEYHKAYLKDWLSKSGLSFSFEELWEIRENCLRNMAQ